MPIQNNYTKPYEDSKNLLDHLKKSGFRTKKSDSEVIEILDSINCFYLKRYRWNSSIYNEENRKFVSDRDHLDYLLSRYTDDIKLRNHLLVLINIVEDILKAKIIDTFGAISPDYHLKAKYPDQGILLAINSELEQENFIITHFREKYTASNLPVWKAIHCISFGKVIRMIRLDNTCTNEKIIQDKLLQFLGVTAVSHFYNRLDAIRWLRNACAHFDHIIARSLLYYPKTTEEKINKKTGRKYLDQHRGVSVNIIPDFIDTSLWTTKKNKTTNITSVDLKFRCFAWYYQILYEVLRTIVKTPIHKEIINQNLSSIERIVQNLDYNHLKFNFNRAKFNI